MNTLLGMIVSVVMAWILFSTIPLVFAAVGTMFFMSAIAMLVGEK